MSDIVTKIRKRIDELHDEFEKDLKAKRQVFRYHFERRRIVFEKEVAARHRYLRMSLTRFLKKSRLKVALTAPVIYSLIIPFALMDLFVTVYQAICFPIYKIPKVKRSDYVVMDRKYLGYLNVIEKMNCIYCEYCNGVVAYVREVAGRTEHYWCPIKHARKAKGVHPHYYDFLEYGEGERFHEKLQEQREKCRACEMDCGAEDTPQK